MKKILLHIDTPHPGGATRQLYLLVKHLDRTKYIPTVVCGMYPELDEWAESIQQLGISVLRIAAKSPRDMKAVRIFWDFLRVEKPDLVHLHLSHSGSCRQALLACALKNSKVVVTEHDPFALSPIKHALKKAMMPFIAHTIAISTGNKKALQQRYKIASDRISVVHNGIDVAEYENVTPFDIATLGIPADHQIVSTIAEIHPRKGINYLVDAIPTVLQKLPKTFFLIVGTGESLRELQRSAPLQVIFLGKVSDIRPILARSDLYVLPSVREAFGLTVIEAMASHKAVLTTTTNGPSDIIQSNVNGVLVPPQDSSALAEQMIRLLPDAALRSQLAEAGCQTVKTKFTTELMTRNTEKIYEATLARNTH